jgi:hypothetical protein
MSYGNLVPYRRRVYGHDERFGTGSLLFDLHRHMHRIMGKDSTEHHKTRLFSDL